VAYNYRFDINNEISWGDLWVMEFVRNVEQHSLLKLWFALTANPQILSRWKNENRTKYRR